MLECSRHSSHSITLLGLLRDWNEEFQEAMTAYRRENINQQANAMMGGLKGKGRHKDDHDYLAMSIDGISLASLPLSVRVRTNTHNHTHTAHTRHTHVALTTLACVQASLQVVDLVKEFTEIAEVIAQIIVDELHCPVAEKLIPPTQLGGMAGGEKYLSHGILFKFAIDSRGLYNGDEFAMKATQVRVSFTFRRFNIDQINLVLMCAARDQGTHGLHQLFA